MDTINESEDGHSTTKAAGPDPIGPPLCELIAEIDRQTAQPAFPGNNQAAKSLEPAELSINVPSQFISFTLDKTLFALPLASALEIGHRPEITRLPNLPNWVLGISNIRGEIISLVNLKAFLGIPHSGAKGDNRFIIIHNQDMKVGLIVEKIMGMLSLDQIDSHIMDSPYREGEIANFISSVALSEDNLLNILDIDKLLSSRRMTGFTTN